MNKTEITGKLLMSTGLLLICAAIGLAVYNSQTDMNAKRFCEETVEQLREMTDDTDNTQSEQTEIPDYVLNPDMDMPAAKIDDKRYIGILEIPYLGLELPVAGELSYPNLRKSPCRYKGSAYTDDMIIAAHNYQSNFGRLKNLHPGSSVRFIDIDGNIFDYTTIQTETLNSTAVEEMDAGDWDLTLFTCTIGGKTRVTVRCIRERNNLSELQ